jgi:hypothetical protein
MDYQEFIESKRPADVPTGIDSDVDINPMLFGFQSDITRWALRRGRAAIFADCGLGKTPMQLEWAAHVVGYTERPVLVVAPLAVSQQTIREGRKFGVDVTPARTRGDIGMDGVYITNYEQVHNFDPDVFGGVVLDESSILKSHTGKYRTQLIEMFANIPFRLAATATPAPNDHMELANHAEFLGVMSRNEMLATFFVHDSSSTQEWRLKGHAEDEFWKWMASWAVSIAKPSDLGYADDGYTLPELRTMEHIVTVDHTDAPDGMLFRPVAVGLGEVREEQKRTVEDRARAAADIINASDDCWIVWVNRNDEADAVCAMIPDAVEVRGSDNPDDKARRMLEFSDGQIRVLVTKPSIAGFGMNWQHCANMAFVGLSYSYEQFYQASRRCWRFGQTRDVNCHVIVAETEGSVLESIRRKDADATKMHNAMIAAMRETSIENVRGQQRKHDVYTTDVAEGDGWTVHLGDCVDVARSLPDESIHASIFSPPFASLYTYSNSLRDMGNVADDDEFFRQFGYLVDELHRIMVPGRNVMVHCMNLTTTKGRDGHIGMRDFRGDIIRQFRGAGFIYHSEVCIWKDPVVAMQRTKAHGLLYKTLRSDSARSRQGIPDTLLVFRKDGDNPKPITHTPETFSLDDWQDWASPVWFNIDQSNVLNNYRDARDHKDERHICPLQLDLIERALRLWSAPDDLVFSPFTGIGSEGFVSLKMGRRFVGAELKPSYWRQACVNLQRATEPDAQLSLLEAAP